MLLVKTSVGKSDIHGQGLFAKEFIPAGTKVWNLIKPFDVVATKKQMDALPDPAREQMYNFCYRDMNDDLYVICGGDARYMNHSDSPNTREDEQGGTTASVDIEPNTELTCDYYKFDADAVRKLGPKKKTRKKRKRKKKQYARKNK
jgi:SET domain-containing protein